MHPSYLLLPMLTVNKCVIVQIHYNGWSKSYDEWMFDDDPRLNPDKAETSKLTDQTVPTIKIVPKPSKPPKMAKTKKSAKQKVENFQKSKMHQKTGKDDSCHFSQILILITKNTKSDLCFESAYHSS